jgi:hypothetical protein
LIADLRSELITHLAPQALFIWCSPGFDHHCYKFSPLQAHWGKWCYTHLLQPACLFTVHMGSVPSPLSSGAFLTQTLLQAFPLQGCWVGTTTPAFSGQFAYSSMRDCPSPLSALRVPCPLCCVFCCCCLLFSFFFSLFSLGGSQSVQGAMVIWPRVVCGSTACRLANLVVCISRASGSWRLVVQEPSWFLRLPWSGDTMCGLVVWRSWGFASFWWFFL